MSIDKIRNINKISGGWTGYNRMVEMAMMNGNLTLREHILLMYIMQQTIGWQKFNFKMKIQDVVDNTSLHKSQVYKTLTSLENKGVIDRKSPSDIRFIEDVLLWDIGLDRDKAKVMFDKVYEEDDEGK